MADRRHTTFRLWAASASLLALVACGGNGFDIDLRGGNGGLDTTDASRQATQDRPRPDENGIISYPSFDVAVARGGDTVASVAARVGTDAETLARHNGLEPDTQLRRGEVVSLPMRVADLPAPRPNGTEGTVDIATLAGNALDRVPADTTPVAAPPVQTGPEPVQHQVVRGETAYTIARLYNVSVRALSDWNGLGPDLTVREGQFLLIPLTVPDDPDAEVAPAPVIVDASASEEIETVALPGEGSVTPVPPSASTPLPDPGAEEVAVVAEVEPVIETPARTAATASRFSMPVAGAIIRDYEKGVNDGIDIAASPGTEVKAAGSGTVAAITRDTDGVPILVLRHSGNLLTVYANIEDVAFEKDQDVRAGDTIATVRSGGSGGLHFQVREGFESVDPIDYLN